MDNLENVKQHQEDILDTIDAPVIDVQTPEAADAELAPTATETESQQEVETQSIAEPTEEFRPETGAPTAAEPASEAISTAAGPDASSAPPAAEPISAEAPEASEQAEGDKSSGMAAYVDTMEFQPLKTGDVRDGIIVSISPSEILVDVGSKSEGVVPGRELERLGKDYLEDLKVGDSVVVYVVRPEDKEGNIILSLARAQQERDWREAERLLESGDSFESTIIGYNRGGVICRLGKVRGFVPASQLVTGQEGPLEGKEEERLTSLVGQNLWLKVVELDRRRNRLILSERQAVRERRRQMKDQLLSDLKKGDIREGRVSSVAKFGAFVDLGGADGLIHLSELAWSRVNHPGEVLKVGDRVKVYVLNVDRDRKRIGLSLRRLEPEPWSVVHERYAVGQLVEGVITKLASFGAFARIDGAIEGLIHISELADHRVTHPKEVVKEGDHLSLRIIRIDPSRRRMGLSLKRVAEEAYAELDWREQFTETEDDVHEEWGDDPTYDDSEVSS